MFCLCSDFESLNPREAVNNGQLGLDTAEREFGISPIMTGTEMSLLNEADSLSMVVYLSQIQQLLKDATPSAGEKEKCYAYVCRLVRQQLTS